MARRVHRPSEKIGFAPGTLIHVGIDTGEPVTITIIDYNAEQFEERQVERVEECRPYKDTSTVTWINVEGIHSVEVIEQIGGIFGLHPLLLEDVLNPNQRPKLDIFDTNIFIVLKMLSTHPDGAIKAEQISVVVGANYVLTFQEHGGDVFDPIRQHLRENRGKARKLGADYLAYVLIDLIVDNYFVVLEAIGDRVESTEDEVIASPSPATLAKLHQLRRTLIFLRRAVWPLRDAVSGLLRGETDIFHENTLPYLRDVYDHTIRVGDTIETFRDTIAGLLDVYLSSLSHRMNEVMKVLTVISTIFMPLTFIAGVYGMNFHNMPELDWRWGYGGSLALMAVVAGIMIVYFRRKKWF